MTDPRPADLLPELGMSGAEWLTEDEVEELTGRAQPSAQIRMLTEMGIHGFRRNGRVIVSRWAVRMQAAGVDVSKLMRREEKSANLNWTRGPGKGPDTEALLKHLAKRKGAK